MRSHYLIIEFGHQLLRRHRANPRHGIHQVMLLAQFGMRVQMRA